MTRKLLVLVVLMLAVGRSHAQRAPDTATMDRGDGITRIGFDFAWTFLDHPPYDSALRIEPYGQYVTNRGLGIYGSLPFARSFGGDGPPDPDDATALGNLDVGGIYVHSGRTTSWVLRGGLALPTASDSADGALTNALATFPRLTDAALAEPNALYLRFGFSPLFHANKLFLQLDLGLDLGLGTNDADPPHYLRFNVGGGVDLGKVALGLELVNLGRLDNVDNNDTWVHALSFTLRFMGNALQPVIAIGAPLDDSLRDVVDLYIAAGIQIVFH